MKPKSGRDMGTLLNLKNMIQRSDVNGNVKSRFQGHEDFVLLAGKAYALALITKHFDMEHLEDLPKKYIPEDIGRAHKARRQQVFDDVFGTLTDAIVGPCSFEEASLSKFTFYFARVHSVFYTQGSQISDRL